MGVIELLKMGVLWIVIIGVGILVCTVLFIIKMRRTLYMYKGKQYRLLRVVECKDKTTRLWYRAALYENDRGQVFCRPLEEFVERFVPMKGND